MGAITKFYDLSAIENADLADTTKVQYRKALANYLAAGGDFRDPDALADYASKLPKSSRSFLKAAIRLATQNITRQAKARANPDNVAEVQAVIYRVEAIQDAIHVAYNEGRKAHTWLTQAQVRALEATCTEDRDWIAMGLLLGAGLRREEAVKLTFGDLKEIPTKNGNMRPVLDVAGKGAKDRVVPIKPGLAKRIHAWRERLGAGPDDLICRSVSKGGEIGAELSGVGLFKIVRKHGAALGRPELAPHDCRRTYAQLGYAAGIPLTQIMLLLGHSSLDVTKRYLDLDLDLDVTVSDFIPWNGE